MIKIFPVCCIANFVSVFTALNNTKKQRRFNITPCGENVYQLTYLDKILNPEGYIFDKFFTTYKFWGGLPVFARAH